MFCIVLNYIRANGNICTMKCRFTSLSTPTIQCAKRTARRLVPLNIYFHTFSTQAFTNCLPATVRTSDIRACHCLSCLCVYKYIFSLNLCVSWSSIQEHYTLFDLHQKYIIISLKYGASISEKQQQNKKV